MLVFDKLMIFTGYSRLSHGWINGHLGCGGASVRGLVDHGVAVIDRRVFRLYVVELEVHLTLNVVGEVGRGTNGIEARHCAARSSAECVVAL